MTSWLSNQKNTTHRGRWEILQVPNHFTLSFFPYTYLSTSAVISSASHLPMLWIAQITLVPIPRRRYWFHQIYGEAYSNVELSPATSDPTFDQSNCSDLTSTLMIFLWNQCCSINITCWNSKHGPDCTSNSLAFRRLSCLWATFHLDVLSPVVSCWSAYSLVSR